MREARYVSLIPRTTLHSDSKHLLTLVTIVINKKKFMIFKQLL
jgi:hypothetical protein